MLDSLCFQSQVSFNPNDFKKFYDMDMIRHSTIEVCSSQVSFQIPSENLQACQKTHDKVNNISAT